MEHGTVREDRKGIMAGTPLSAFYANLFLSGLDAHFSERDILYARYSDDLIVFAETEEECQKHAETVRQFLHHHM